jgi:hypothetical protein
VYRAREWALEFTGHVEASARRVKGGIREIKIGSNERGPQVRQHYGLLTTAN